MPDALALESLVVENFRSIRGEVVVPLNSPVVLIHGPNGTGKSSLMTALALALAGPEVAPVADPQHLVHHGARYAAITLGTDRSVHKLRIERENPSVPAGALGDEAATFFAERCYLEQTKLTKLLELYQQTAASGAESALTRFVKELLRLDELDALVDGLEVTGDVRRVSRDVARFRQVKEEIPRLEEDLATISQKLEVTRSEIAELTISVNAGLSSLGVVDVDLDVDVIQGALDLAPDAQALARLEALAMRAAELANRRKALDEDDKTSDTAGREVAFAAARERRERWSETHGQALGGVITELRVEFPRLPSLETVSPSEVYDQAREVLDAELARVTAALRADDETAAELEKAQQAALQAEGRLALLDERLGDESASGSLGELSRVLAELAPRVVGNICPVCARDYSEVSEVSLSAHLAAEISRLSARAGQLQATARERVATAADLRALRETGARLSAQRLSAERRSAEADRRQALTTMAEQLLEHERGAREGGAIMRDFVAAEAALAEALRRDRSYVQWRDELGQAAADVAAAAEVEGAIDSIDELEKHLTRAIARVRARQEQRVEVARLWDRLREAQGLAESLAAEHAKAHEEHRRCVQAVAAVRQRMESAKGLRRRVEAVRRDTITGVFNSALNEVWAQLFVRLAPDEQYVPAFAPPRTTGPVQVRLETRRRDGSVGGAPEEMLSAGNLNTAALTLFLALNLSVRRLVPWLLLDDPVQSMDEIHVSQFAALLRTLTQGEPQRKVFIAVHERALFEYLALELSPATPSGSLVTVELRREREGGDSTATPVERAYEPEIALSPAT